MVLPSQLCHASGTLAGIVGSLIGGVTVILPNPVFDAEKTLNAIIKEGANVTFGTPSLYVDMITIIKRDNLKLNSLLVAGYGGAPCPEQLALDIKNVLGAKRLQPIFGMTETAVNFVGHPDDSLEKMISTVGRLTYHLEAKVIDKSDRMVPMGQPGELCIRGYSLLKEYWGDEEKTRMFKDADGWARTGDLCIMEDGGYVKIVGRIKEAIIRIGDKIFPVELEEFFQQHPDIAEIQVFGVPDSKVGEEICAYFKVRKGCKLTEQDIREFCKNRLPEYRIPRYIRFINEFPRGAMGKVIKSELLETLMKELKIN